MRKYIFEVIGKPEHGMTQALNYVQVADSEREAYRLVRETVSCRNLRSVFHPRLYVQARFENELVAKVID